MLTLYIVFAWLIGICYGFVLISSAAGHNDVNLFQSGQSSIYQLHSTVLLNENTENTKNVGFFITGNVLLHCVWSSDDQKILKIELRAPQLHIRARKTPPPDGFVQHSSNLDTYSLKPFYVVWSKGIIEKILLPKGEPIALSNFNKGIASLFQFQILDVETNETDASGHCKTTYQSISATKFFKLKTNCVSSDLPYVRTSDPILDVVVTSNRQVTYELDQQLQTIQNIYAKETHSMTLAAKEEIGNMVDADLILNYLKTDKTQTIAGSSLEEAWESLKDGYEEGESLLTKREEVGNEENRSFVNMVNDLRENIAAKNLGNLVSAKAFLRLLEAARKAKKEEISKVLSAKKNQKILTQIYDILGYVQTIEAHSAIMKKLHFDREDHSDLSERYLWSLSLSQHPNSEIIKDLLERNRKNDNYPDKVKATLVLTIAAMAHAISVSNSEERKIINNVEEIIINSLNYAKGEERYCFFRALRNLKSSNSVPLLLETIKTGSNKEGVLALKALKAMGPSVLNPQILRLTRRVFLQIDRRYDSSARTLAADILLENHPTDETLKDFVYYLKFNDTNPEIEQYVLQRLLNLKEEDEDSKRRLEVLFESDPTLYDYDMFATSGLSTALKRNFLQNSHMNGSLFTTQEMFGGVVKRGVFDVILSKNDFAKEMISLGIFAGGLSGLVGNEMEGDEETATAGIELTILDRQIRPFVFFTGQSELMGHVWSGTASERTPALQALILLQDHLEFIRLGPGYIAELNLKTAMSFDLSGNIEISIWSRTADSLVEKSAGIVTNGVIKVDTSFVQSQIEFSASIEPKLDLKTDSDFSGNTNFCIRVSHPDSIFRHNVFKIERIPGSKHKIRIAKYKKTQIPGKTYSLNRKSNEKCSAMFS